MITLVPALSERESSVPESSHLCFLFLIVGSATGTIRLPLAPSDHNSSPKELSVSLSRTPCSDITTHGMHPSAARTPCMPCHDRNNHREHLTLPNIMPRSDARRGQTSSELSLITPTELFTMNTSLLTTATKDDSNTKTKLNDTGTESHSNVGQISSFQNRQLENVVSLTSKDSSLLRCMPDTMLANSNGKKSIGASKPRTIETNLDCHIFLEGEPPCKEYSHNTPQTCNGENSTSSKRTTLVHSESAKVMVTNEKGIHLENTSDNSVEKILSPDHKISMFSKEIWSEKVLPIDTFVCPEPEIVEIYFDKRKMTNQLKRCGNCSAESTDSSTTRRTSKRGVLGRKYILNNRSLSNRKDRTSSSGRKTINFDDEIWSVCPKLIPSGKMSSLAILENRDEVISPEKLTENGKELSAISHPPCGVFRESSKSNTKQYDLKDRSRSTKMIEPTHEIEGQNEFAATSEAANFSGNNYLRSTISQADLATVEISQRFDNDDEIFCEPHPVVDKLDQKEGNNFSEKEFPSDAKTSPLLTSIRNSKQEMRKSFESGQMRTLRENPLSMSNSEPVSTVLKDILNRRDIDSLYGPKLPTISCNEIISLYNVKLKQSKEDHGSSFHAYPLAESVKQFSSAPDKNHEVVCDRSEKTFHTPTEIVNKIFQEVDEPAQLSVLNSENKIREKCTELGSKNQDTYREIHGQTNHLRTFDAVSSSKLSATESRNVQESVKGQEIEKTRKFVKMVRFRTSQKHEAATRISISTKLQENFIGDSDIKPGHSKVHFGFDNTNDTPDCISAESVRQEIDQPANQIIKEFDIDPALDDVIVTLAKVEIIVEANRQTVEKLQQLQPNVTIPQLTPPDVGQSLAKALMRCRNYLQNNGFSRAATSYINRLLTSGVQNLKQLVEWQKLTLATRGRKLCATTGGRRQSKRSYQENSLNTERGLTPEEFGLNQAQCLISDILTLTEKLVPNLNGKELHRKSLAVPYYLHNAAKNSTKNRRAIVDAASAAANDTDFPRGSKIGLDADGNRVTQSVSVLERNTAEETVKSDSGKPKVISGAASNPRMNSHEEKVQIRSEQRDDIELETTQLPAARSTYSKKISSTESSTEKRTKTLPRHYNANDSTNNFRSQTSSHSATVNQKTPVWKPGGNNFVQPSISVIPNNQKVRMLPSSSVNKKKNASSEHTRDRKPHQRTKTIPSIINDSSKILEKSVLRPQNTTSMAKIRSDPARRHRSEMLSIGRSKGHISTEVDESRMRKPRSKSRTRTKTPNKISRITVTEIPLEHADDCSSVTEQETPVLKEVRSIKKASTSPKDIIQMLEELIKSSGDETSIHNVSPVQVVGQCNIDINNLKEDIDRSALLKTEVKLMYANDFTSSNERGDHGTVKPFQSPSIQSKSVEEIVKESEIIAETNGHEILIVNEKESVQDTLARSSNLPKELTSKSSVNAEEVFTVSRSNSEAISNRSTEGQTAPSVSNIGCTAELSSEHSIGSVFSKYCQASLTSLTSHEISEELISNRISDTGVTSYCEGTQKDSNESFDTVEDHEVPRENFAPLIHQNQSMSSSSNTTPKKKYFNKHAKSLEMLKEILSDQGLGIHLLSRAENELRDRCKCSPSKRGLTARRSLQGANFTTSRFSGDLMNRVSLLDRKLSSILSNKLATLSESESDIEHAEVSTMTSANDSAVGTSDYSTSVNFDSNCSKVEKTVLRKILTVENATQFDVTSKSDMCVGDGIISDYTRGYFTVKSQENHVDNSTPLYTPSTIFRSSNLSHEKHFVDASESFESKIPDKILDAFRLAAIKGTNFYAAINILRENMLSKGIPTHRALSGVDEDLPDADKKESDYVQHLSTAFRTDDGIKLPEQSRKPNINPPVRIIIPRIRVEVNDEVDGSEPMKYSGEESEKEKVAHRSITTRKESSKKRTGGELRSAYNLDKVNINRPIVPPKLLLITKQAFNMTVDKKTVAKEEDVEMSRVLTAGNKSFQQTEILLSAAFGQKKGCQSPLSSQQSLVKECLSGERIETLHFAGRKSASIVGNSANTGFANYGSPEVGEKFKDSFGGSLIRNLLEENLQRFKADNPIVDEKVFADFGEQLLTDSSDDEVLRDKLFVETTTSTSCTHLDNCNRFSEVKNLLNCLLNAVGENCKSSTVTIQHDLNTLPVQHHCLKKHIRRSKSERTRRTLQRSLLCDKYSNNSSGKIVSREHLLSLIYAAICSFVFFCLQLSVHCEV